MQATFRAPARGRGWRWAFALAAALGAACGSGVEPLPTRQAVLEVEREAPPPPALYQLLYDQGWLPASRRAQQRVRILVWLRALELEPWQLRELARLRALAVAAAERVERATAEAAAAHDRAVQPVYDELWARLTAPDLPPLDAPELDALARRLAELREAEAGRRIRRIRLQALREVLDEVDAWIGELGPRQRGHVVDAVFLLRDRLDPYARPGAFRALVGSLYEPGRWGLLVRDAADRRPDHLDIARLWSEARKDEGERPVFDRARAEVIVLMALLEPALADALEAELARLEGPAHPGAPPAAPPTGAARPPP